MTCQESTEEAVILWAQRVQGDYNRKVPKNANLKQKAFSVQKTTSHNSFLK